MLVHTGEEQGEASRGVSASADIRARISLEETGDARRARRAEQTRGDAPEVS